MKYLILGGAGFIGQNLAKRLIKTGNEVTIIDSLSTSHKPDLNCEFVLGDITKIDIEKYIKESPIVYFLAGSVGVEKIIDRPGECLVNNINLINALFPLFKKYKPKVIFSSTSEVYGDGPFAESNNLSIGSPENLRWSYAASKLLTEFYFTTGNFPYIIARFFNIVGPGQLPNFGMVLPRFIKAAKNNEDLIVHGDGSQVRSFCHIEDAINILLQIQDLEEQIFNVGNDEPITIKELAEKVIELSGSKSQIKFVNPKKIYTENYVDINKRIPDLTKLKQTIIYTNKYSIDDIIKSLL
jgi:UDP-glucose 4-epimerase